MKVEKGKKKRKKVNEDESRNGDKPQKSEINKREKDFDTDNY